MTSTDPAEQAIMGLLASGGANSISPTDAARLLSGNPDDDSWRRSLSPIRQAAFRLARAGRIDILRKGRPVAPEDARGVIRLRLAGVPAAGIPIKADSAP
jgi:hypothetical protein